METPSHRFQFTSTGPPVTDRRSGDRRQGFDEPKRPSKRVRTVVAFLTLAGVLSTGLWNWRYVVYAPLWLARRHWADRSDLYLGSTNGISNESVVQQARNYLDQINRIDVAGNIMAPEQLRPLGAHLDVSWFQHHHPQSVDYNPFLPPSEGNFIVTWQYVPSCQKTVWKSPRLDTNWYDLQGQPCYGVCNVSVLMAPNLKLTAIKLSSIPRP